MATSSKWGKKLHSDGGIDPVDSIGMPFFVIATLVTYLEWTFSGTLFGTTIDMAGTVWSPGGLLITWAWVLSTVVLIIAALTNEIGEYEEEWHRGVPIAMGILHLVVLFPAGHDLVVGNDIVGLFAFIVFGLGYFLVSWY